jgi:hypothetical protein
MKCPGLNVLFAYLDGELAPEERSLTAAHLLKCPACRSLLDEWKVEDQQFREVLTEPSLPDSFVSEVRKEVEKIARKSVRSAGPEKSGAGKPGFKWMKRTTAVFVLLMLGVGITAWASPTFAEYLTSTFRDFGLLPGVVKKNEYRNGYSVTDKGYTLRVTEVLANTNEVYFIYQVEKDGKILDVRDISKDLHFLAIRPKLYDAQGKWINAGESHSPAKDWRSEMVGLKGFNQPKNSRITLVVKAKSIQGVQGNWELKIPLDLSKARVQKFKPGEQRVTPDGKFAFTLKEVSYTPTSAQIVAGVRLNGQEEARHKERRPELHFAYQIVDQSGKVISGTHHEEKWVMRYQVYPRVGGGGEYSFGALPKKPLYLLFDTVYLAELTDKTYEFIPGREQTLRLNRAAYTLKNARLGKSTASLPETPNHLLVDLTKTSVVENEDPLLIAKENLWLVYDESGKEYSGLVLNDNGRWVLEVPDLYRVPEKLKIRPYDVTVYKYQVKIPLPDQK